MDIIDKITSNFNNSSYDWAPHVAFISFLLISSLVGFAMGRRTSIYFGVGMIFAIIIGIIVTVVFVNFAFNQFVPKNLKIGKLTFNKLLSSNRLYLQAILFLPVLVFFILMLLLLQLIFFIILRKRVFKKRIISLKEKGLSTKIYRVHGMLIALAFMAPIALIFSSYFATLGKSSSGLIYSKTMTVITLGQVNSPTEKIRELMLIASSASVLLDKAGAVATILGDPLADHKGLVEILGRPDGRNALRVLILSPFVNSNVELLTGQLTPEQLVNIDLDSPTPNIDWMPKIGKEFTVKIPEKGLDLFTDSIANNLKKAGAKISPEGLRYLLLHTNIISI